MPRTSLGDVSNEKDILEELTLEDRKRYEIKSRGWCTGSLADLKITMMYAERLRDRSHVQLDDDLRSLDPAGQQK